MKKYGKFCLVLITSAIFIAGCDKNYLDPTQIGRFRPIPSVNIILDSLGVAEEAKPEYEGAEDPRPADAMVYESDYTFSSGDVARVTVFELLQEGVQYVDNLIINETGNISLPEIGQIQASGLTETQLEDEIKKALSPGILRNPSVTVSLMQSQSRVFTILGDGVAQPGRYTIPRYDYRLMDALADAGSVRQFNVSYIYISRQLTNAETMQRDNLDSSPQLKPIESQQEFDDFDGNFELKEIPEDSELMEVISPSVTKTRSNHGQLVISSAELVTDDELAALAGPDADVSQNTQPVIEWTFKDGKWIPVKSDALPQDEPVVVEQSPQPEPQEYQWPTEPEKEEFQWTKPAEEVAKEPIPADYGWDQLDSAGNQTRVIKIPRAKLLGGDPRYNIVIKPGDRISAQLDVVGEFYVLGNVNNQGIINLTGRPMTLKMAIAAAGGLGQLAWPKKCEIVRRIGEKKEEIVMVDLVKIANGTQPDFFVKPNDVINVGTHGASYILLSLRQAFRATYGFGFTFDRNFNNYTGRSVMDAFNTEARLF